jgi:hypothetical protein
MGDAASRWSTRRADFQRAMDELEERPRSPLGETFAEAWETMRSSKVLRVEKQ